MGSRCKVHWVMSGISSKQGWEIMYRLPLSDNNNLGFIAAIVCLGLDLSVPFDIITFKPIRNIMYAVRCQINMSKSRVSPTHFTNR